VVRELMIDKLQVFTGEVLDRCYVVLCWQLLATLTFLHNCTKVAAMSPSSSFPMKSVSFTTKQTTVYRGCWVIHSSQYEVSANSPLLSCYRK